MLTVDPVDARVTPQAAGNFADLTSDQLAFSSSFREVQRIPYHLATHNGTLSTWVGRTML